MLKNNSSGLWVLKTLFISYALLSCIGIYIYIYFSIYNVAGFVYLNIRVSFIVL